jgi:hypothetical protein
VHDQSKHPQNLSSSFVPDPQLEDVNSLNADNGRGDLAAGESEKANPVAGDETRRDCGEVGEDCSS